MKRSASAAACASPVAAGRFTGFDYERKKPVVMRPANCMVACVTCANTCLQDAISFPPVEGVRELIRKEKILTKAMLELKVRTEELKSAPKHD